MPLTFPSHAAAVLPLKLWRPTWFDGVALVVGSTAPDLPYALGGYVYFDAHNVWALFWFCVPITMLGTVIIRRAAPIIAANLPDAGAWHLQDYGSLGQARYPWYATAACALFGAFTHIFWDSFTHARATFWSPSLDDTAFAGRPWWWVLQQVSTIGGAIAAVLMARQIGTRRLLLRSEPGKPRWYVFWPIAVTLWVIGIASQPLFPAWRHAAVLGVRVLFVTALALLIAAASVALVEVDPGVIRTKRRRSAS